MLEETADQTKNNIHSTTGIHFYFQITKDDGKNNTAIVDYTSPMLCTLVTSFLQIGDVAYRQHARGGPSHRDRQQAQKFGKDHAGWFWRYPRRQTDRQTDILITILRHRSRQRSNNSTMSNRLFTLAVYLRRCEQSIRSDNHIQSRDIHSAKHQQRTTKHTHNYVIFSRQWNTTSDNSLSNEAQS